MIRLASVKKYYAARCVLDIPALTLAPGKRYALIGPNGSGKSTLLRLIAGVMAPEEGTIEISEDLRGSIAYMPQRPYAYSFSVLKNVVMALGKGAENPEKLAAAALEEVGMTALLKARGNTLSGGEAQRMAFARMIVRDRGLMLLDEPTSAMDIPGTRQVEEALIRYCERTGCTVVFATHALAQAERLADDVILLTDGKIMKNGPAKEVLYDPEAEFIRFWQLENALKEGE